MIEFSENVLKEFLETARYQVVELKKVIEENPLVFSGEQSFPKLLNKLESICDSLAGHRMTAGISVRLGKDLERVFERIKWLFLKQKMDLAVLTQLAQLQLMLFWQVMSQLTLQIKLVAPGRKRRYRVEKVSLDRLEKKF